MDGIERDGILRVLNEVLADIRAEIKVTQEDQGEGFDLRSYELAQREVRGLRIAEGFVLSEIDRHGGLA